MNQLRITIQHDYIVIAPARTDYTESDTTVTLIFAATISTQMAIVSITEFINLAPTSVDNTVILNQATARISIEGVEQEFRLCHYYILPGIHLHRTSKVFEKPLACVARHLQLNNIYAWIISDICWHHTISLSLSLYTAYGCVPGSQPFLFFC